MSAWAEGSHVAGWAGRQTGRQTGRPFKGRIKGLDRPIKGMRQPQIPDLFVIIVKAFDLLIAVGK